MEHDDSGHEREHGSNPNGATPADAPQQTRGLRRRAGQTRAGATVQPEHAGRARAASGGAQRRTAIVTGGASGIGRALAEELARRDLDVVIADRQADLAQEVADAIRAQGGSARGAEVDVRSFASLQHLVHETTARAGRLDYLFNNAGIGVGGPIESYSLADWDDVLDVNVRGVVYGVQAAYPVMIAQGFGHIVNTASMAGLVSNGGQGSYTTSKFAVVGLSKALRIEAAHHGVRVSVLCPGVIRTPILRGGKYGRVTGQGWSRDEVQRMFERLRPIEPEHFARRALDAVERNTAVIVIPSWWRLVWLLDRVSPALSLWLATRTFARMRAKMNAP